MMTTLREWAHSPIRLADNSIDRGGSIVTEPITIVRTNEETEFDDNGRPVPKIRVTFKIGADGPFSKSYDRAAFNGDAARRDLETFARELETLRRK